MDKNASLRILLKRGTAGKSLLRLFTQASRAGRIVRRGTVSEWNILGFEEREDGLYLYGSFLDAHSFFETIRFQDKAQDLQNLAVLAEGLSLLERNGVPLSRLYPEGIFFLQDGGLLFLPEDLMERLYAALPAEERPPGYGPAIHPDLEKSPGLSFSLGCFAYRILLGVYPFKGEREEEIHTDMRSRIPLAPNLLDPGVREEVSAFILSALSPGSEKPSLESWAARLRSWCREGFLAAVSEEERRKKALEARRLALRQEKERRRRLFLSRHGIRIAVLAAALLVAGSLAGTVISNLLKPRITRGLAPEEVVKLFYESIGRLDHATMEDCVTDGAGKGYISEVTHLFVISRMRLSVEMKESIINAADWDRSGRPPIPEGKMLYGITLLSLEKDKDSSPEEPIFIAAYERWAPERPPEGSDPAATAPPGFAGFLVEERITMIRDRGDWVLRKMEKLSEKVLP